ncbi:hypothetical protein [Microvirga sp. TS319]|uniref:hypothetical protein n=1 Tax=Microvirga sp. TS319 TaxID=3241165 RepID=UPI00351A069D
MRRHLDPPVRYTSTSHWNSEATHHVDPMDLIATPELFEVRLRWRICPKRADLVSKLSRSGIFGSRKAHRLAYRSRRENPCDRAISQAFKHQGQLGSNDGIGAPPTGPRVWAGPPSNAGCS